MTNQPEKTDYSKHSDEELRDAIRTADEEYERVQAEDSADAAQANRDQRQAMQDELGKRTSA